MLKSFVKSFEMKITLLCVGKTVQDFVEDGIKLYSERLSHYCRFSLKCIPNIKGASLTQQQIKQKEGELILKELEKTEPYIILLDEKGKCYDSVEWSCHLEKLFNSVNQQKELFFIVGGAYGFSQEVYNKAKEKLSLSAMTFSHQMVRLIFVEQLYRAFTIMKGEPYHHK